MHQTNYSILQQSELFSSLPQPILQSLAEASSLKHYEKDEVIIKEDTHSAGCYIILSGTGTVYSLSNQAGLKRIISQVGPHSIIGELSVISGEDSLFSVVANGEVECLFIGADTFRNLLKTYPVISQILLPIIVKRMHIMRSVFFS